MTLRLSLSICLALVLPGCAALEQMATSWTVDEAPAVPPEEIAASELERSVAPAAPAAVPPPVAQPPKPRPKPTDLARDPPSAKPKPTELARDPPGAKPKPTELARDPPSAKPKPTELARDPPGAKPKSTDLARDLPSAKIKRLFGLSIQEAQILLGAPFLQTEMPPAKVLAYDGKSCTLSVFFYLDLDSDRYRALAYEIKGGDGSAPAKQRCLSDIFAGGSA